MTKKNYRVSVPRRPMLSDKDVFNITKFYNQKNRIIYIVFISIIIILSLFTNGYLTARVINEFYRISQQEDIKISNVHTKRFLCAKGYC